MDKIAEAERLRSDTSVHYNCCQTVLMVFAEECGLSIEECIRLGSNFGSGMGMGSTCGVITAGLMVSGLAGGTAEDALYFKRQIKANHGATDCSVLLRSAADRGISRKAHCDGLIYEAIRLTDEILNKRNNM